MTTPVWGSNGNCTIPMGATGLSMDVVAVNPSAASFLTVFPSDQPFPLSSNLNWVASQPPTPNAVTVSISADGKVSFFNNAGTVDLAVDIVGFYEPSTSGPAGPPGPPGPSGPSGVTPVHVVWVASGGGNFTSVNAALTSITDNSATNRYVIKVAPGTYTETASVVLKDYVDIEGSGQDTTTITCSCGSNTVPNTDGSSATMNAGGLGLHSEVRFLTVANTGPGGYSTGLRVGTVTSAVSFSHVTTTASGGGNTFGVFHISSSASMTDVTAVAVGGSAAVGIFTYTASPSLTNVTATAITGANNYGVFTDSSNVTIRNSSITGATKSISMTGGKVVVWGSKLSGATEGGVTCYDPVNAALAPMVCS